MAFLSRPATWPSAARSMARLLRSSVVEAVYPRLCAGCGSRGAWLCTWCEATVPALRDPICERCGMPVMAGVACWCHHMHPTLYRARSVYPYTGWVREAVHRVKYRQESDRAGHVASLMAPHLAACGPLDALVPVPLHESRLEERGFNQAELLARHLADTTGTPFKPMLARTLATAPQARLSLGARQANLRDAFALAPGWSPLPDDRVLLIDDVRTTGATLNACASVLFAAGVARVSVLTFALDLQERELDTYLQREGVPAS